MTAAVPHPWSLTQLHLLMTGECNFECDHCFVWGGPSQSNTMTEETIEHLIEQKEVLLLQKGRATARLVVKPLVEVEWMKDL